MPENQWKLFNRSVGSWEDKKMTSMVACPVKVVTQSIFAELVLCCSSVGGPGSSDHSFSSWTPAAFSSPALFSFGLWCTRLSLCSSQWWTEQETVDVLIDFSAFPSEKRLQSSDFLCLFSTKSFSMCHFPLRNAAGFLAPLGLYSFLLISGCIASTWDCCNPVVIWTSVQQLEKFLWSLCHCVHSRLCITSLYSMCQQKNPTQKCGNYFCCCFLIAVKAFILHLENWTIFFECAELPFHLLCLLDCGICFCIC